MGLQRGIYIMNDFFTTAYEEANPQTEDTSLPTEAPAETPTEQPVNHAPEQPVTKDTVSPTEEVVQTFEVNGEHLTLEELQRGYMRQSDYTRKTQEVARQREELAKNQHPSMNQQQPVYQPPLTQQQRNQQYIDQMYQRQVAQAVQPMEQRLQEIENQYADNLLNEKINTLKTKYSDFDEISVLNEAYKRGTDDLDFIYRSLRKEPDMVSLKEQLRQEIMQEINTNNQHVDTLVQTGNSTPQVNMTNLSERQLHMAQVFGMTPEEYAEYL